MSNASELKRIDPPNCGCTDCATGYSKPINICTEEELEQLRCGELRNASGKRVTVKISEVEYSWE